MKKTRLGQYNITDKLFETNNSVVYGAIDKTGNKNAIKFIKKESRSEKSIKNEIKINYMIDCNYILPLKEAIKVNMQDFNYAFVMPKANEDLYEFFKKKEKLNEDVILEIMHNLLMALNYIHGIGIIHRNVKLENILFINDQYELSNVVLSDFCLATSGFSNNIDQVGSLPYMAPEMHEHKICMIL